MTRVRLAAARLLMGTVFTSIFTGALGGAPARADNEISVRVSTAFTSAGSGVAATGSNSALVEGEFGYARLLARPGPTRLWIEGDYMIARRSGTAFGISDTLTLHRLTVGGRLCLPIPRAPWLQPHVRLGAGAGAGQFTLTSFGTSSWAATFTGHALAGLEILIPRSWMRDPRGSGVTAGLVAEGGVTFATQMRFLAAPDQPDDTIHTPLTGTQLGTLDLTAAVVRVGAVLWF